MKIDKINIYVSEKGRKDFGKVFVYATEMAANFPEVNPQEFAEALLFFVATLINESVKEKKYVMKASHKLAAHFLDYCKQLSEID